MLYSMKMRGFTVVEIVITITVMGILLALAVVNISSTQVNARDAERKVDVEAIGNYLEIFYKNGSTASPTPGRYPSTQLLANGETSLKSFLPDVNLTTTIAPGATNVATSFLPATNSTQTETGVSPQPTTSQYVYQPIQTDGSLCNAESQECRKFNIFYKLENDNSVKKVMSKNQ